MAPVIIGDGVVELEAIEQRYTVDEALSNLAFSMLLVGHFIVKKDSSL